MNPFQLRPVLYFILLSFGLAWLLALPLWLDGGLQNPLFAIIGPAVMATPALAAVIVSKLTDPTARLADSLGLSGWRPLGRTIRYCSFAVLASMLIFLAALATGWACGVYQFDIVHFSGLQEMLNTRFAGHETALAKLPSIRVVAALLTVQMVITTPLVAILTVGEEIGWRGWLLPKLMPLGTIPALIISGVIWALWHTPMVLLGYNYGSTPGWLALLCMSGMCIVIGSVLAWMRLRSGTVWPAALGHAAFNAGAGFIFILGAAGQKLDMTQATPLGWTGWIFPALLALLLFTIAKPAHGPTAQL